MKNIKSLIFTTIILMVAISGCTKQDDVKPEILVASPTDSLSFLRGGEIVFKADFTDNKELSSYKIDVHGDFDKHAHGTQADVEWVEVFIGDLSGVKQSVERLIMVPATAKPGDYHFIVKCIDVAGNESKIKEIDIIVSE
jgi:hypothetical protein